MKKGERELPASGEATSIGEALRAVGFGEEEFAAEMQALVVSLRGKKGSPKLLLDTLKECGRHLGAAQAREFGDEGPVQVELVHNVARPAREKDRGKMGERDRQIGFQFEKETI